MPHPEKVKPAFSQVGALSVGFGLSVLLNSRLRGLKQTLPIRPNASSRIIIVDYVFPDSVHRRLLVYYKGFSAGCQENGEEKERKIGFFSKSAKIIALSSADTTLEFVRLNT